MGFLDSLGRGLGSTLGKMGEEAKLMNEMKREYEGWSNNELKAEYRNLKSKSGDQARLSKMAIRSILKDRGVID